MTHSEGTNYYEVLEVAPDAPQHEIHRAYQRAKSTYSQDNPALYSMFSQEEARELLRLIEEAYSVLGNQTLRKNYDESVLRPGGRGAGSSAPTSGASAASSSSTSSGHEMQAAHQSLPEFGDPSSGETHVGGYKVVKKTAQPAGLPPGMGRTALSTYKIDKGLEDELEGAAEFDGSILQKVRLYKNISLDKLSDQTRISRPYLTAVETNDYKNLPAAVYVRGFVVQVARALGLDESKVATSYMKKFKAGGGK